MRPDVCPRLSRNVPVAVTVHVGVTTARNRICALPVALPVQRMSPSGSVKSKLPVMVAPPGPRLGDERVRFEITGALAAGVIENTSVFYNMLGFGKIDFRNPTEPLITESDPAAEKVEPIEEYKLA